MGTFIVEGQPSLLYDYINEPEIQLNEDLEHLVDQFIYIGAPINSLLDHAKTRWKFPKFKNDTQYTEADWTEAYNAFLNYGEQVQICRTAELCTTFYKYGTCFLIWLSFTGPDQQEHRIKIYMPEYYHNIHFAMKIVDGIQCNFIYNAIVNTGYIPVRFARKMQDVGSVKWSGTAESRNQLKLNSAIDQKIFEYVVKEHSKATLKQLDPFDDYLYKGDPGKLADYDLILPLKNGSVIQTRIDLKLLKDVEDATLQVQNPHDAELLICSSIFEPSKVRYLRVANLERADKVEETEEFKMLIETFSKALDELTHIPGSRYIKINHIDMNTGKVDFTYYT